MYLSYTGSYLSRTGGQVLISSPVLFLCNDNKLQKTISSKLGIEVFAFVNCDFYMEMRVMF